MFIYEAVVSHIFRKVLPIEIIKEIDYTTMSCWYTEDKKSFVSINLLYPVKNKYQSFIEMGEISNE